jgi:kinesin family protein 15
MTSSKQDQLTCLKKQQNCPGSPGLQLLDSDFANEFKSLCGVDNRQDCDLNVLKQKVRVHDFPFR